MYMYSSSLNSSSASSRFKSQNVNEETAAKTEAFGLKYKNIFFPEERISRLSVPSHPGPAASL